MADATTGIFTEPYKEYKRLRSIQNQEEAVSASSSRSNISEISSVEFSASSTVISSNDETPIPEVSQPGYANRMTLASATSLAKF